MDGQLLAGVRKFRLPCSMGSCGPKRPYQQFFQYQGEDYYIIYFYYITHNHLPKWHNTNIVLDHTIQLLGLAPGFLALKGTSKLWDLRVELSIFIKDKRFYFNVNQTGK
jgi:hypothetical protein